MLAGLKPDGAVEVMLAERLVSLSWRLKRAERMSNEFIDVKIARIETNSWENDRRKKAGLVDPETGRSELILGWTTIKDFGDAQVLERLLMYEKRIESSLYKAMNELQKIQLLRKKEQIETMKSGEARPSPSLRDEDGAHRGRDALATINQAEEQTDQLKKQTQSSLSAASANSAVNEKQSQFQMERSSCL